jgi:hypothetical protein
MRDFDNCCALAEIGGFPNDLLPPEQIEGAVIDLLERLSFDVASHAIVTFNIENQSKVIDCIRSLPIVEHEFEFTSDITGHRLLSMLLHNRDIVEEADFDDEESDW